MSRRSVLREMQTLFPARRCIFICPKSPRRGGCPSSTHLTCAGRPAAKTVVEMGFVGYKEPKAILAVKGRMKTQEQARLQSLQAKTFKSRLVIVPATKLEIPRINSQLQPKRAHEFPAGADRGR